jgi:hypothetical protein
VGIIIGHGDGGQISEQGDEDDKLGSDGFVNDDHRGDKVDFQVQAEGNTVLDVGLHTLEDLTGNLDGIDDGAEARSEEDDVGSGLCSFGGTFDGDTAIRFLERGSIVDTTGDLLALSQSGWW